MGNNRGLKAQQIHAAGCLAIKTSELPKLNKIKTRTLIGLITDHCPLWMHYGAILHKLPIHPSIQALTFVLNYQTCFFLFSERVASKVLTRVLAIFYLVIYNNNVWLER